VKEYAWRQVHLASKSAPETEQKKHNLIFVESQKQNKNTKKRRKIYEKQKCAAPHGHPVRGVKENTEIDAGVRHV